jgi:hypothetical protein
MARRGVSRRRLGRDVRCMGLHRASRAKAPRTISDELSRLREATSSTGWLEPALSGEACTNRGCALVGQLPALRLDLLERLHLTVAFSALPELFGIVGEIASSLPWVRRRSIERGACYRVRRATVVLACELPLESDSVRFDIALPIGLMIRIDREPCVNVREVYARICSATEEVRLVPSEHRQTAALAGYLLEIPVSVFRANFTLAASATKTGTTQP